jgi:hypothetical protein
MKSLTCTFVIFLVMGFAAGQTDTKAKADFQAAAHWFDYDSKQPLDIHDKVIENFDGPAWPTSARLSPPVNWRSIARSPVTSMQFIS